MIAEIELERLGDLFVGSRVGEAMGINFERFVERRPHYEPFACHLLRGGVIVADEAGRFRMVTRMVTRQALAHA